MTEALACHSLEPVAVHRPRGAALGNGETQPRPRTRAGVGEDLEAGAAKALGLRKDPSEGIGVRQPLRR